MHAQSLLGRGKLTLFLLDFNETAGFRNEFYAASGWLSVMVPVVKGNGCSPCSKSFREIWMKSK